MECAKLHFKLENGLELEILDVFTIDPFITFVYQLDSMLAQGLSGRTNTHFG